MKVKHSFNQPLTNLSNQHSATTTASHMIYQPTNNPTTDEIYILTYKVHYRAAHPVEMCVDASDVASAEFEFALEIALK